LADKPKYLLVKKVKKVKKKKKKKKRGRPPSVGIGHPPKPWGPTGERGGEWGRAPPARLPGIATYLKKRRVGCGGLGDAEAPRPSTTLTPVAALRPTYLPPSPACLFWFAKNSRSLFSLAASLPSFLASRDCS
jgi:hypothetical protein